MPPFSVQNTKAGEKATEQGHKLSSICRLLEDHVKNLKRLYETCSFICYGISRHGDTMRKILSLSRTFTCEVSFAVMSEMLRIVEGRAMKKLFAPGEVVEETPTPKVTKECGVYRRSGQTQIMRRNTPCCGRLPSPQDIRPLFEAQISTCYFISTDRLGRS